VQSHVYTRPPYGRGAVCRLCSVPRRPRAFRHRLRRFFRSLLNRSPDTLLRGRRCSGRKTCAHNPSRCRLGTNWTKPSSPPVAHIPDIARVKPFFVAPPVITSHSCMRSKLPAPAARGPSDEGMQRPTRHGAFSSTPMPPITQTADKQQQPASIRRTSPSALPGQRASPARLPYI